MRIRRLMLWRAELESSALPGAIRYDGDPVQTSPEDRMSGILAKVADLDAVIKELLQEKARAVLDIGEAIERLEDETQKTVLAAFYIGRLSMDDVAEMICYSRRQAYRIRREAVEKMAQMAQEYVLH
jgi:DNA-directed RNA polymerase specialized sigma subunit